MDELGITIKGRGDHPENGKSAQAGTAGEPREAEVCAKPWFNEDYYLAANSPVLDAANLLGQLEAIGQKQK